MADKPRSNEEIVRHFYKNNMLLALSHCADPKTIPGRAMGPILQKTAHILMEELKNDPVVLKKFRDTLKGEVVTETEQEQMTKAKVIADQIVSTTVRNAHKLNKEA